MYISKLFLEKGSCPQKIVMECLQMKGTLEGETILPWKDFDWHFQKLFVSTGEREWKPRRQIYNQIAAKKDKC